MTAIRLRLRDCLIVIGGYVVEPIRSVRARLRLLLEPVRYVVVLAITDLDAGDLRATVAVGIYLVLATVVVVWATSMFVLVRWMLGY